VPDAGVYQPEVAAEWSPRGGSDGVARPSAIFASRTARKGALAAAAGGVAPGPGAYAVVERTTAFRKDVRAVHPSSALLLLCVCWRGSRCLYLLLSSSSMVL
jgi:hypothetical protein